MSFLYHSIRSTFFDELNIEVLVVSLVGLHRTSPTHRTFASTLSFQAQFIDLSLLGLLDWICFNTLLSNRLLFIDWNRSIFFYRVNLIFQPLLTLPVDASQLLHSVDYLFVVLIPIWIDRSLIKLLERSSRYSLFETMSVHFFKWMTIYSSFSCRFESIHLLQPSWVDSVDSRQYCFVSLIRLDPSFEEDLRCIPLCGSALSVCFWALLLNWFTLFKQSLLIVSNERTFDVSFLHQHNTTNSSLFYSIDDRRQRNSWFIHECILTIGTFKLTFFELIRPSSEREEKCNVSFFLTRLYRWFVMERMLVYLSFYDSTRVIFFFNELNVASSFLSSCWVDRSSSTEWKEIICSFSIQLDHSLSTDWIWLSSFSLSLDSIKLLRHIEYPNHLSLVELSCSMLGNRWSDAVSLSTTQLDR